MTVVVTWFVGVWCWFKFTDARSKRRGCN